jgi:hypothetical protein
MSSRRGRRGPAHRRLFLWAFILAAPLIALGSAWAVHTDGPPSLLGDAQIEQHAATERANHEQAFPFRASASGEATSVAVYLDRRSRSRTVEAAIYDSRGGHPGALMTSGNDRRPTPGKWNTLEIPAAELSKGTTYWLALLGLNGVLVYRDRRRGPCSSEHSKQEHLRHFPQNWQPGRRSRMCPASMFVAGSIAIASSSSTGTTQANGGAPQGGTTTGAGGTGGTGVTGGGAGPAPVNVVAPYFTASSGDAVVGQTLTVSEGAWTNSPTGYSYHWYDCTTSGGQPPMTGKCSPIRGATESAYTVAPSDVGQSLAVVVTAVNGAGAASTSLSGSCAFGENDSQNESDVAPPPAEAAGCSPVSAVAAATQSGERFCSNAFVTCGYPDPLTGDVGVPPGTALTTVSASCGCLPAGAAWSNGTVEVTGSNVVLRDLYVAGSVQIVGNNDVLTDSEVTTGICGSTCSNGEPVVITGSASNTQVTYDTLFGGANGTVHNGANEPILINHIYSYGACGAQLGFGDVWNSFLITDIVITNANGQGPCHTEPSYVAGGILANWPSDSWGGACPGVCSSPSDSYANFQNDVLLNPQGQTAAIFLDNHAFGETGNNNITVNGSFLAGGGYVMYGDASGDTSSNIVVSRDRWSSMYYPNGGYYGACAWNNAASTLTSDLWDATLNPLTRACVR